jgi:DNA-binding response OmpR family regulator
MTDLSVAQGPVGLVEEENLTYPVSIVLTLQREQTASLLRAMRSQQVLPAQTHAWGSERAYSTLLHEVGPRLTVLDVPGSQWNDGLEQRVRALSNISSVVVLIPDHTDSVRLLLAGAANVLPRDSPPRELASRIAAERRWLDMQRSPRRRAADSPPFRAVRARQHSQQVLLDILCSASRPWCCHDLCLLLGTAGEPMSRRALQGRIVRLNERLTRDGLSVDCTTQWGRTTFLGLVEESGESLGHRSAAGIKGTT